jgi:hypothetical protein
VLLPEHQAQKSAVMVLIMIAMEVLMRGASAQMEQHGNVEQAMSVNAGLELKRAQMVPGGLVSEMFLQVLKNVTVKIMIVTELLMMALILDSLALLELVSALEQEL